MEKKKKMCCSHLKGIVGKVGRGPVGGGTLKGGKRVLCPWADNQTKKTWWEKPEEHTGLIKSMQLILKWKEKGKKI